MKFEFSKVEDCIIPKIITTDGKCEFDYVRMVNFLYQDRVIEPSEFLDGFSGEEKENIEKLLREISEVISEEPDLNE